MAGRIVSDTEISSREQAFLVRQANFPDEISFYAPGLKRFSSGEFEQKTPWAFRSISLTGSACALQCDHCQSKILDSMVAFSPKEGLFNLCKRLATKGTKGVLISGGSQRNGVVPLLKHIDDIARIKNELEMRVMVHCGIPDESLAAGLKMADVDGVMLDIIGANETIRDIYHLDLTVDDFERAMELLTKYEHSVRPHIILGLHYGKFIGEYQALEMLEKYPIHALVLVILMPMSGTPMQNVEPPAVSDIKHFFCLSRTSMPQTPLMLGCAKSRGEHKIAVDKAAIDYGLNGLAYPAEGIVRYAQSKGLQPNFFENACSCGC